MSDLNLLMVCTGNICRSPMAAFMLAAMLPPELKEKVRVSSAGTHAMHGYPAEPLAVHAMAGLNIDLRSHRARPLSRELLRNADLVLTMELAQQAFAKEMLLLKKGKVRLLTDFNPMRQEEQIADPYGGPLADYLACIDTLRPCLAGVSTWVSQHIDRPKNR